MAKPKMIDVKESVSDLKKELKQSKPIFTPRLRMLIAIKNHPEGLSKQSLSEMVGVNHNSIQKWRAEYEKNGLKGLLTHGKVGFKKSVITKEQHQSLKKILNNPENGIQGYKELKIWFEEKYRFIPYTTLVGYCIKHFNTKIKVARKSHVKKDEQAVETFKKTLVMSSVEL